MQMCTWTLLFAVLATCAAPILAARPFSPNRTAILRTHSVRNPGVRSPGSRRRARDIAFLTSPLPTPTSPRPSLSGPYWANLSLVDVAASCNDAAKPCLRINRLLHEPTGRCYPIGDSRPCNDTRHIWVLDASALEQGQLRGVCRREESCNGFTMAYDGVCHNASHIVTKLCHCRATLVRHPTGRYECSCPDDLCPDRRRFVRQPSASGRCVVPDLQRQSDRSYTVDCTPFEAECLRSSRLPFQGKCVEPLTREICPRQHWLTFAAGSAFIAKRLHTSCSRERFCGHDALLLHIDGGCHTEREVRSVLCPNETLLYLPTGDVECTMGVEKFQLSVLEEAGMCTVSFLELNTQFNVVKGGVMECARDDNGNCNTRVEGGTPSIVIVSED